jgi:phosphatidylserine/phosphatidylglycerophosphate/cardiolipin synthase-like enzyme
MRLAGTRQCRAPPTLDRFDAALGDGIERAMVHHHMRRLRRHGHLDAIAPASEGLWARTSVPPREGNALEVLIDGANALPRMAEAIRNAKRHVHICSASIREQMSLLSDYL